MWFLQRFWRLSKWRLLFLAGRPRRIDGVPVSILFADAATRKAILENLDLALAIIAHYSPRNDTRLRRYVTGILVQVHHETPECRIPRAWWRREVGYIVLSRPQALAKAQSLAGALVAETTRAWLASSGFQYHPAYRRRIEAICVRAEASLYRRLEGGAGFAQRCEEWAQHLLTLPLSNSSDAVVHGQYIHLLRAGGAPRWIVGIVERISARQTA